MALLYDLDTKKDPLFPDFLRLELQELALETLISGGIQLEWGAVTEMDLFSIKQLTDKQITQLYKDKLNIDINTKWGIRKLNRLFSHVVDFYKEKLFKKVWSRIKNNKDKLFTSKKDAIEFLKETTKWTNISQLHCNLSKVAFALVDTLENPEILESDERAKFMITEKIIPWLQIEDYDKLMNFGESRGNLVVYQNGKQKIINFLMTWRGKTKDSATMKIIYNPNYSKSELLEDPIWLEFEVESVEEAILLLNHFYVILFYGKIDSLKDKWIINEQIIKKISKDLDINFLKYLEHANTTRKPITNKYYKDVKIQGGVDIPIDINRKNSLRKLHKVEFRCKLVWNLNKKGLSSDLVYGYFKIIIALARIQWYVTENYIKLVINELLKKEWDIGLTKEEIFDYYTDKLVEINRGKKYKIYTSKNRYITLSKTEFYPERFEKKKS